MTNEEAIKHLSFNEIYTADWKEAILIAKEAIEKQVPKKPASYTVQPVEAPIQIGHGNWGAGTTVYQCPSCKRWVSKIYKHCPDCGQALDWRDEE